MKKLNFLLIGLFMLNFNLLFANKVYIYDELGSKLYFQETKSIKFISISPSTTIEHRKRIKQNLKKTFTNNFQEQTPLLCRVTLKPEQESKLFSELQREITDVCISSMLMYSDSTIQWTSNEIIVKTFPNVKIEEVLNKHSIPYKKTRQLGSDLQTFVITLSGIEDKTIEYSNQLYESEDVVFAQPSFWRYIKPQNAFYIYQWGFNNTGQYGGTAGIDINAPEAWTIASGVDIKIAVIDEGVDLTHPELDDNLLPGYDATDGVLGGSNGSSKGNDAHGTACAGIIVAEDNSEGVKGIAYNAKTIPIRIAYEDSYDYNNNGKTDDWLTNDAWLIDGFYNAWYNKQADVLSNSWAGGSNSIALNNEINAAVTQGRDGKGCVVVFGSGNDASNFVGYPANLLNVIAVGAISQKGDKSGFSNYGSALSIVAPGEYVYTTDMQGFAGYGSSTYVLIDGTSAACPHVSGVAALILSINPDLTSKQVRDIIEQTAQKVGGYNYTNSTAHPNGTWNNEMGYGLVNAYKALLATLDLCPSITLTGQNPELPETYQRTVCKKINIQNATVPAGTTLILDATDKVTINPGFKVEAGASFIIK